MLEPVSLHQTRFNAPGVQPDSRGILLGRQGVVLLASIDRVVGFFRLFCDETSLEDIHSRLKIEQVRGALDARQFVISFQVGSSYLMDRVSRIAATVGGAAFTGSGKHFILYRDRYAPLGYDLAGLETASGDYLLYGKTGALSCSRVKEIPFTQLVLSLELLAVPGLPPRGVERDLWLLVREGLAESVLGYLWRSAVPAEAALVEPQEKGSFSGATSPKWLLLHVPELPERVRALFSAMPGVEIFTQQAPRFLVQRGHRHPLRLAACGAAFGEPPERDRTYIFSATRKSVDVIEGVPALVPSGDLLRGEQSLTRTPVGALAASNAALVSSSFRPAQPYSVAVKLEPSQGLPLAQVATLVPWSQVDWLKRLVYLLPAPLLGGAMVMALDEGLFVWRREGIEGLPLGKLFAEVAPRVLAPLGFGLSPHAPPQVLSDYLGARDSKLIIFLSAMAPPVALDETEFEPLGRRVLANLEVAARSPDSRLIVPDRSEPSTVINDSAGIFPLWGMRGSKLT